MEKISVKWNANPATVRRLTDSYLTKNMKNLRDNLTYFSDTAAEYIRKEVILKDSPTGTMWHKMVNKERGNEYGARVETGQMLNNVGSLPADDMEDGYSQSEFGLFTGGDSYFMRQEYGFDLQLKNGVRKVKGMYSARRAMKYTKPLFRKKMLSTGFLRGKRDSRGRGVLNTMAEGRSFDYAWRESAPEMSIEQKEGYAKYRMKVAESARRRATMDLKWAANSRVIDALKYGKDYSEQVYRQTIIDINKKKGKL